MGQNQELDVNILFQYVKSLQEIPQLCFTAETNMDILACTLSLNKHHENVHVFTLLNGI